MKPRRLGGPKKPRGLTKARVDAAVVRDRRCLLVINAGGTVEARIAYAWLGQFIAWAEAEEEKVA